MNDGCGWRLPTFADPMVKDKVAPKAVIERWHEFTDQKPQAGPWPRFDT
jgi:hypothetical protein